MTKSMLYWCAHACPVAPYVSLLALKVWWVIFGNCRVFFRHGVSFLFFFSTISIFLSSLGSANVHHLHWWALSPRIMGRYAPYCRLASSLLWYLARLSFQKSFWSNAYPTFTPGVVFANIKVSVFIDDFILVSNAHIHAATFGPETSYQAT